MTKTKTLFVVGAGASNEVGLPLGSGLTGDIARLLEIKFDDPFTQISGDHGVVNALKAYVKDSEGRDIDPFLTSCWRIRDAMPQAASIDAYVYSHRGNAAIELCSKLGITAAILEAERGSKLFAKDDGHDRLRFDVGDTWYVELFQLITDRCTVEELPERLASIAFIVFNYDRCIEHFLFHAIQTYYSVDAQRAAELLTHLDIHHPFGVVGKLPWQQTRDTTPFGAQRGGKPLLAIANRILTVSESSAKRAEVDAWGRDLAAAQTVVFLGFGFHEQNMALLVPIETEERVRKQVFATAHGISDFDQRGVMDSIHSRLGGDVDSFVRRNLKCAGLFREFSSGLML